MTEPMTEQRLEFFEAVSGGWITELCAEIRRRGDFMRDLEDSRKIHDEARQAMASCMLELRASEMREIEATKRLEDVEGFACKACANNESEAERLLARVKELEASNEQMTRVIKSPWNTKSKVVELRLAKDAVQSIRAASNNLADAHRELDEALRELEDKKDDE